MWVITSISIGTAVVKRRMTMYSISWGKGTVMAKLVMRVTLIAIFVRGLRVPIARVLRTACRSLVLDDGPDVLVPLKRPRAHVPQGAIGPEAPAHEPRVVLARARQHTPDG